MQVFLAKRVNIKKSLIKMIGETAYLSLLSASQNGS